MTSNTETQPEADTLGARFAHAIANGNADDLNDLLQPDVDFRAVTPGRFWEARDAGSVVNDIILGTWFPPHRITAIVDVQASRIGPLDQVRYRFEATLPDGPCVVEQQAYLGAEDGRISWVRITCSGFVPAEASAGDGRAGARGVEEER